MYVLGLISWCLFVLVSGNVVSQDDQKLPELRWPKKYTFQVDKTSLTSGLVEYIQYWRTLSKSRVDYNNGAVKTVKAKPRRKGGFRYGVKYEVHPETTEEEENYLVCKRINGTFESLIYPESILPDEDQFEHVGSEVLDEGTAEKFVTSTTEENKDVSETLWAVYNSVNDTWTPIRYEYMVYDLWLSCKTKHNIWFYYNFDTDFESADVFNFDKVYDCEDSEAYPDELGDSSANIISAENENHVDHVFNSFKEKHNRIYADKEEHSERRNIFQKNMRLVLENNSKNTGYKLAINKFADRTPEEMKRYMGLIRPNKREPDTHAFPYTEKKVKELASKLPNEFDLRDLGVITPVKDQDDCGSCWTFGTTSAVEGALARKNGGRLLRLSNQALIDCAWGYGSAGCNGGYDIAAYHWMMEHGLPTEEEYGPYANKDGFCQIGNMTTKYPIRGFTNVTPFSVDALKVAIVNHGPLSVSIHATDTLLLYNGGVFYDLECDTTSLNHEVTLVGYGRRDGDDYWIVKNSWGQTWGTDGYLYISVRDNNCGIATEPTYVVV